MKPKLEALRIAEVKLEDALKELEAAESKLQDCQAREVNIFPRESWFFAYATTLPSRTSYEQQRGEVSYQALGLNIS